MYWCCLFAAVTTTFSIIKGLSYLKKEKPIPCRVATTHCFFQKRSKWQTELHKERKKVPSSCVLPGHETGRVNSECLLLLWLSGSGPHTPPCALGGYTGTTFVFSTDTLSQNYWNNKGQTRKISNFCSH